MLPWRGGLSKVGEDWFCFAGARMEGRGQPSNTRGGSRMQELERSRCVDCKTLLPERAK
jgi:hypothetical protein